MNTPQGVHPDSTSVIPIVTVPTTVHSNQTSSALISLQTVATADVDLQIFYLKGQLTSQQELVLHQDSPPLHGPATATILAGHKSVAIDITAGAVSQRTNITILVQVKSNGQYNTGVLELLP